MAPTSVAGSGPRTSLGPTKRPGPTSKGPDRDRKNLGPVLGPGPGPRMLENREGLQRTGPDQSSHLYEDWSRTSPQASPTVRYQGSRWSKVMYKCGTNNKVYSTDDANLTTPEWA